MNDGKETSINPTPYPHIPISPYTHTHIHPYTYTPVHPYTHTPQTVNYLPIHIQKPWEKSDLSNIENMCPLDSKTTADKGEQFYGRKNAAWKRLTQKSKDDRSETWTGPEKKLRGNETST